MSIGTKSKAFEFLSEALKMYGKREWYTLYIFDSRESCDRYMNM